MASQFTDAEFARLEKVRGKVPRARWLRDRALGTGAEAPVRAAVPELNRAALRQLSGLTSNLNQLTRAANEGKSVDAKLLPALRATYARLNEVRQLLMGEWAVGEKKRE